MAHIVVFVLTFFIATVLIGRFRKRIGTIEGRIRNLRVSRPLYKNSKREGTRFDFQVWIENGSGRDIHLGSPTIEINLKNGKVHEWKLEEEIGNVVSGGYVLYPKRRDQYVRLYLDDVPQHDLDLYSLSASARDDKGSLRVFIQE